MVVLPEMLVADWHLASSELGSSRIPTVWQDLAHSTTQICHTECATQWFATPGAAPAVSPETHTAQIWLTHCWRRIFQSASWKLQYNMYHKHQDLYHNEMYATTSGPPQQVQSCTTIMSSGGAIIGAHCHPPCPGASPILSTRSNVPRRPRPDFASVNAPIGFVGTVLLIPVVWSHNQFEKKDSCCAIMWSSKFIYDIKHFFLKKDFSCLWWLLTSLSFRDWIWFLV